MAKRVKRSTLKNKADKLFSLLVRSRGICEKCGRTDPDRLQCAHIVPRKYLKVRFDEDNAFCLCSGCHVFFTHNPLQFEDFVATAPGVDYADLRRRALSVDGLKVDYEAVIERLEERLSEVRPLRG